MKNKIQNEGLLLAYFVAVILMFAGLYLPRAWASIGMILFVLVSFIHADPITHYSRFFKSPLLVSLSFLFWIPLISGLWSTNSAEWFRVIQVKLPLLFLPLAFASPTLPDKFFWEKIGWLFLVLAVGGAIWSLTQYAENPELIERGYLRSNVLRTPLNSDHVRFSFLVSIAALVAVILAITKKNSGIFLRVSAIAVALFLIVFLHILAARTGLFLLYAFMGISILWLVFRKSRPKALLYAIVLAVLPLIVYLTIPTFKNRIDYMVYDARHYTEGNYLPGSNDGNRFFSIYAGLKVYSESPLIGVGFGDLETEMKSWYAGNLPESGAGDRILPHSEGIIYGAAAGILGFLIFMIAMMLPIIVALKRKSLPLLLISSGAALSLLFDVGLEIQYGVFIYLFPLLWFFKWFDERV